MHKICPKCAINKEDFDYSKSSFKVKSGWCRFCTKNYNNQYRLYNNSDKKYYDENKDKKKAYSKLYRINNNKKSKC